MSKRIKLTGKFVIGHDGNSHVIYEDGCVVYQGDEILFVGHDYDGPVDEVWDTGKSIVSPGFIDLEADVDTDHANFDPVLWGRVPRPETTFQPGPKFRTVDPYTDEDFSVRQKYSMAQLIMNGITTAMPICGEQFHGWAQTYHEFEIMAESVKEMGIRAYLGPSFKSCGIRGGQVDEVREKQSFEDALRYFKEYDGTAGGMIRGFINPCQIAITRPEILRRAKDFAVEVNAPMRLHACEEDVEWKFMLPKYGKTTIDFFDEWGLLCPQLLIPHAITLKDSDIRRLAEHRMTVIHTPIAEINYGAGLNSFSKYQTMGINMSLGTDAQPVDMIQNMRLAWDIDRFCEWHSLACRYNEDDTITDLMADQPDWPKTTAADYFNAATINGAKALGRDDLGKLAPGARADIVVVDLDDLRVGPYEDPIRTLVVSCVGNNVRHTIIGGVTRMKDWKLVGVDEEKLRRDAQRVYEKYLSLFGEYDAHGRGIDQLCPPSFPILKR